MLEAGRPKGMLPIGLSAIETLRIESGLLFPDVDYFPHETDPVSRCASTGWSSSTSRATSSARRRCKRDRRASGTPRLLTTLVIEGSETPEYGAAVTQDGREVGIVRSPCESPTLGKQIAMAAIDRDQSSDGTEVEVALGDGTVKATAAAFPIYDTEKTRPRS